MFNNNIQFSMKRILFFATGIVLSMFFNFQVKAQTANAPIQQLQEFPSTGSLVGKTVYKITKEATLNAHTVPPGITIIVMPGGKLNVAAGTFNLGKETTIQLQCGSALQLNNSTLIMGENSYLKIDGEGITGRGTIKGNFTALSAPIKRIFGSGIQVGGQWTIDRAYPQWFAPIDNADWSQAINCAMKMKVTGEVFIPRGTYIIAHTLYVPFGIQLRGEGGRNESNPDRYASILKAAPNAAFNGDFMMMINIKHLTPDGKEMAVNEDNATWEANHPIAGTEIRNLYFLNEGSVRHRGVLVAGGAWFDQNTWNGCLQAVCQSHNQYSDMRKFTNNTVYSILSHETVSNPRKKLYAFDLTCLGDALTFEGNAVHDVSDYNDALKLYYCTGGSITANILNADILIDNCKSVLFSANHLETGAQLTIRQSTISTMANFFEKRDRPSVMITGGGDDQIANVSMNSDLFLFYNGKRGTDNLEQNYDRINSISEFDIATDRLTQLSINNLFRYDLPTNMGGLGHQITYGINIAQIGKDNTLTENHDFKRFSYDFSMQGQIALSNKVRKENITLDASQDSHVYLYGAVNGITWFGESGRYTYGYEILDNSNRVISQQKELPDYINHNAQMELKHGGSGVLLRLGGQDTDRKVFVRLFRTRGRSTQSVEIPLSGNSTIYDNGLSVCGYKWK